MYVRMCVPTSVSCGAPEDDDVNRPDLGIESWASGYAITRGYGGFWVFEALLNASWVWVFLGMGTQKYKCQSVRTMHTFMVPYTNSIVCLETEVAMVRMITHWGRKGCSCRPPPRGRAGTARRVSTRRQQGLQTIGLLCLGSAHRRLRVLTTDCHPLRHSVYDSCG